MKISELIKDLQAAQQQYGDLEVGYWTGYDGWEEPANAIEFRSADAGMDMSFPHVRII